MQCHHAVGKGAASPARMIIVKYKGGASDAKYHAIVGKVSGGWLIQLGGDF